AVRASLEDAFVDHPLQSICEDVPGHTQRALHLRELAAAVEDRTHHQQRPALADELEAASDGADLSLVFLAEHHCDLCTLGCMTQPTLLGCGELELREATDAAMGVVMRALRFEFRPEQV